jgi:glycosyltransferase involved in cell wall biosynthesis
VTPTPPRLALLADYREEGWASMDLCADMLADHLRRDHAGRLRAELVCPPFCRRFGRLPVFGRRAIAFNADRFLNRLIDYPRAVRRLRADFDLFHLCDHSYSQLVHELPADRAGVFCHDLDTFRCLLDPSAEPRSRWFRAMTRRILRGLERAAIVFHTTWAMRHQIERHGLIDPARLVLTPYGVAPEFTPDEDHPALPNGTPGPPDGPPFLLHVGSCIPRKRIDILLQVIAAARAASRDLRLVKVGGEWTTAQREQIDRLGLGPAITHLPRLAQPALAPLYRRAALVLVPSEMEGFGLPVIEALACGATVLASDLPTLREAGGLAAVYLPVGDVAAWADAVTALLARPDAAPPPAVRRQQAARFTWAEHARVIADAYLRLAG